MLFLLFAYWGGAFGPFPFFARWGCPFCFLGGGLPSLPVNKQPMTHIFLRALRHLIDPMDKSAARPPFLVEFCTSSGEVIRGKVVCTSSSFEHDTFNFRFVESDQVRKVHACLLLSWNGREVML